jgi:hypothetical protein
MRPRPPGRSGERERVRVPTPSEDKRVDRGGRMRRRRRISLCCLAIGALVIPAACTDGHTSVLTPVFAPSGRTSAVVAGACTYSITHDADQGLVTVDDNPATVTATWFPGMNMHPCQTQRSVGGTAVAGGLATDIVTRRRSPAGRSVVPPTSVSVSCSPSATNTVVMNWSTSISPAAGASLRPTGTGEK